MGASEMDEIDFETDSFSDIVAKDPRYNARAYALLMDVINYLVDELEAKHIDAEFILDEFRERTLDQYGPLSYTVLTEWGVERCEDIGEMMFNLVESKRVNKDQSDSPEAFVGRYDFKEAFKGPYEV